MKRVIVHTVCKKMLADIHTPVGIYLRLRDRFRDTILLESTDHHAAENSFSFICINAIAGIEIRTPEFMEYKMPGQEPEKLAIGKSTTIPALLAEFLSAFECKVPDIKESGFAQGLYGYSSYEAVQFFETIGLASHGNPANAIPLMRYRFYQYVIAINHFNDELFFCENKLPGLDSEADIVESLVTSRDVPVYPFCSVGEENSNMSDDYFKMMVEKGQVACHRGDVFQVVVSRAYTQKFTGDEFNVYRALRNINPSPYLFYFDYGDYRLFGSSPESQLMIKNGEATLHPIAGTFRRTGNDAADKAATERLLKDPKENAEHVMLVDLARNDLSRLCDQVQVVQYRQVRYYSHVIHLVSEVTGQTKAGANGFELMAKTFPAGTLSGAPKYKAMQLIHAMEPTDRGYYGGAIGFMGFDGSCNHAIMIRSFLSRNNTLHYQAGAGIVAASVPEKELEEVKNKLGALKKAVRASGG
jgi:anthranilate synthase component I